MVCMWHDQTRNLPPPSGLLPRSSNQWQHYAMMATKAAMVVKASTMLVSSVVWSRRSLETTARVSWMIVLYCSWSRPCRTDRSKRWIYILVKSNVLHQSISYDHVVKMATAICCLILSEYANGKDFFSFLVMMDWFQRKLIPSRQWMTNIGQMQNHWKWWQYHACNGLGKPLLALQRSTKDR